VVSCPLPIVEAVQIIRKTVGWTVARMATEVGIRPEAWKSYEKRKCRIPLVVIERVREATGIDPYVLAYATSADTSNLPKAVQEKVAALGAEWLTQLDIMRRVRHRLPNW
jgi:transcriptional regulator with XRE-family HTH domain